MEWGVASFMPGGKPSIDPYLGREIDRPEVKQEPLSGGPINDEMIVDTSMCA